MSATDVDFNLPSVIKDFLFDLHDATRRSARIDEVQRLYDAKFKEITDKYFAQSPWPETKVIASEVGNDEGFLVFYREMAMRHVTTKLKPQLADHIASWKNYVQLFDIVLNTKEEDLCLSTQWVCDIVLEFVYQFQGFCQFRSQVTSLNAETIKLSDRSELFVQLPLCHFNVFYHAGVSNLLLRKFSTAADVLSEIILHVSRVLKPGAVNSLRAGLQTQLQRALDKAVALTAIATFLCPGHRLDDQVKEIVDAKYSDKIQKLNNTESLQKVLTDLFDFSAPKFISPSVPDYSVATNTKLDVINHIFASFLTEVEQNQAFFKLKSFLGMYASIELDKLARFNDIAEADLVCQLVSAKNKGVQQHASSSSQRGDVHYFVDAGAVIIDSSSAKSELNKAQERFFVAGVRKHAEIAAQINKAFAAVGLE
eukprot:gene14650-16807_t